MAAQPVLPSMPCKPCCCALILHQNLLFCCSSWWLLGVGCGCRAALQALRAVCQFARQFPPAGWESATAVSERMDGVVGTCCAVHG